MVTLPPSHAHASQHAQSELSLKKPTPQPPETPLQQHLLTMYLRRGARCTFAAADGITRGLIPLMSPREWPRRGAPEEVVLYPPGHTARHRPSPVRLVHHLVRLQVAAVCAVVRVEPRREAAQAVTQRHARFVPKLLARRRDVAVRLHHVTEAGHAHEVPHGRLPEGPLEQVHKLTHRVRMRVAEVEQTLLPGRCCVERPENALHTAVHASVCANATNTRF